MRSIKIIALLLSLIYSSVSWAQDKVEASLGADVVSGYIWRGQDLGGVSLQPSLDISYKGFNLNVWGSVGIDSDDAKEVDLTLSYEYEGFIIGITDFWANGGSGYFQYGKDKTSHVFEVQVGYDFGVVALNWFTNIAGADGVNADGKRAYSSYISLAAPFNLGGLEWTAEIGAVPWATDYYNDWTNGFAICDISIGASKEIKVTESFSLPLYAKATFNPRTEGTYFVVGLSF